MEKDLSSEKVVSGLQYVITLHLRTNLSRLRFFLAYKSAQDQPQIQ